MTADIVVELTFFDSFVSMLSAALPSNDTTTVKRSPRLGARPTPRNPFAFLGRKWRPRNRTPRFCRMLPALPLKTTATTKTTAIHLRQFLQSLQRLRNPSSSSSSNWNPLCRNTKSSCSNLGARFPWTERSMAMALLCKMMNRINGHVGNRDLICLICFSDDKCIFY